METLGCSGFANVGDRREAPVARDAKPGAAGLEVTAGNDLGRIGPEVGAGGRGRQR